MHDIEGEDHLDSMSRTALRTLFSKLSCRRTGRVCKMCWKAGKYASRKWARSWLCRASMLSLHSCRSLYCSSSPVGKMQGHVIFGYLKELSGKGYIKGNPWRTISSE